MREHSGMDPYERPYIVLVVLGWNRHSRAAVEIGDIRVGPLSRRRGSLLDAFLREGSDVKRTARAIHESRG